MHSLELKKPDGRFLWLYGRAPISGVTHAPSPGREPVAAQPRLRWHPLRGEWVAYSSHRQNRTFLPPQEFNPLLPMKPGGHATELPEGSYDVAVFDNLFPALCPDPGAPFDGDAGHDQGAYGKCEVVVFSQDPAGSLAGLPVERIALLLEVWAERTRRIAEDPRIRYVMPFENRGVEMGVTLHHPHGQIYAYPVVPPVPLREGEQQHAYFEANAGRGLLEAMLEEELRDGRRVVAQAPGAAAFVPRCARYPYEVWVLPRRPISWLHELTPEERADLAAVLQTVLRKYERLWDRAMPYLMVIHQAPVNDGAQPWFHLHFELTPPLRTKDRLKYLAGTELGAGLFANDALPEESAAQLAGVAVDA